MYSAGAGKTALDMLNGKRRLLSMDTATAHEWTRDYGLGCGKCGMSRTAGVNLPPCRGRGPLCSCGKSVTGWWSKLCGSCEEVETWERRDPLRKQREEAEAIRANGGLL